MSQPVDCLSRHAQQTLTAKRAVGVALADLQRMGVERSSSILLRLSGDKVTFCIGPEKIAWDEVIVLGTMMAEAE